MCNFLDEKRFAWTDIGKRLKHCKSTSCSGNFAAGSSPKPRGPRGSFNPEPIPVEFDPKWRANFVIAGLVARIDRWRAISATKMENRARRSRESNRRRPSLRHRRPRPRRFVDGNDPAMADTRRDVCPAARRTTRRRACRAAERASDASRTEARHAPLRRPPRQTNPFSVAYMNRSTSDFSPSLPIALCLCVLTVLMLRP